MLVKTGCNSRKVVGTRKRQEFEQTGHWGTSLKEQQAFSTSYTYIWKLLQAIKIQNLQRVGHLSVLWEVQMDLRPVTLDPELGPKSPGCPPLARPDTGQVLMFCPNAAISRPTCGN